MKKKKKYSKFIVFAIMLLLFFVVMQQQYSYLDKLETDIIKYREELDEYYTAMSEKASIKQREETALESINLIMGGYFNPFFQEKIFLKINEILKRANVKITAMTFQDPQITDLVTEDSPNMESQVSFGDALANSKKNNNGQDESEYLLNEARKKLQNALEIIEDSHDNKIGIRPEEVNYRIPRVDLTVDFFAPAYESIILMYQFMEGNTQKIFVNSINLSEVQGGWTGTMTLHFYILPDYP